MSSKPRRSKRGRNNHNTNDYEIGTNKYYWCGEIGHFFANYPNRSASKDGMKSVET